MVEKKQRKDSKDSICLALFMLLKKEKYEDISVKQISERAGVSRMSFYRYFKNKDDVFIYFSDERFIEFNDIIHEKNLSTISDLLTEFLLFITRFKESIEILIRINKYSIMLPQYEKYVAYLWRKFVRPTYSLSNILDKYAVSFVSGGLYNTTLKYFKDGCNDDPKLIAFEMYELFKKYVI